MLTFLTFKQLVYNVDIFGFYSSDFQKTLRDLQVLCLYLYPLIIIFVCIAVREVGLLILYQQNKRKFKQ
jgi:hypothetical protein